MRRLVVSYLTISAVIILLANLALIILYARQFSLNAQAVTNCLADSCPQVDLLADFAVVNAVMAGLLLMIWFIISKLRLHHLEYNPRSRE